MTLRLRFTSLFWTFAGVFMLVLVAAAVVQGVLVLAIVQPLASRSDKARAELLALEAVSQIESVWSEDPHADVGNILRSETEGPFFLILMDPEGNPRPPRGFRRPLRGERPPLGGRPQREEPPGRFERHPWMPDERDMEKGLLVRQDIMVNGEKLGEVAVLHRGPDLGILPRGASRLLFIFIPVALLVSGAAGLLLFRSVVRRVRALEGLAKQVEEGDLSARVTEEGKDEIARLAARMNRMTHSLGEAQESIKATSRQRQRFFADITHELSTPLTSIRGFAETLQNPEVNLSSEERTEYLNHIHHEAHRMDLLVEDLLELNRLEAGAIDLQRERLDWAELVRNTVDRFQSRFREGELTLEWKGSGDPAWVWGDGRRLEQVVDNLLINGLRHVPTGGCVSVSVVPASSDSSFHELLVQDDGPGFSSRDIPHLFERFYRADPSRSTPGSGLGLAIVNEIVAQHEGTATAENPEAGGARVRVRLPAS